MILIGFLFLLIGPALLVYGVFTVFKVRGRLAGSAKTTGKVVAFGTINGQGGYLYCPQVAFATPAGQTFTFQSAAGAQPPAYVVGQAVPVVYKVNAPQEAEIDSLTALWIVPGCTVLIALAFTVLGFILFGIAILVELKRS